MTNIIFEPYLSCICLLSNLFFRPVVVTHLRSLFFFSRVVISIAESSGFFVSGWSPGERLGKSNKIYFFSDWLFRVTAYCFAPEFLAHFDSIVPECLQVTNH